MLLQERPELTPDQVKTLLMSTAQPLAGDEPDLGAGVPDVLAAGATPAPSDGASDLPFSSGLGSLDAARGDARVLDPDSGTVLEGELDAQGQPWNSATWVAAATSAGSAWDGGSWNGRTQTGAELVDGAWEYAPWTGSSWSGANWEDRHEAESTWEARSWRSDGWKARSWRQDSWEARSWR